MKFFWYLLALPALLGPSLFAQGIDAPTIARTAAGELGEGKIAELHARFAEDLKAALSEDLLRDPLIKDLVAGAGFFEKVEGEPVCEAAAGMQACSVGLLYERARIRLRIAIDGSGRVAGLFVIGREAR